MRYALQRGYARFHTKYLCDFVFIHINKTGGSSVEKALDLPFQHRTALEIREDIGEERWARRFSFTIVRNPWDKVASHYFYRVKTNQTQLRVRPVPFPDWVVLAYGERDPRYFNAPKMFMPQVDWISDREGRQIVDFVGRFESLADDFATICKRIGRSAELPHLKSSKKPDYRQVFTPETVDLVERVFERDVTAFGYQFE